MDPLGMILPIIFSTSLSDMFQLILQSCVLVRCAVVRVDMKACMQIPERETLLYIP